MHKGLLGGKPGRKNQNAQAKQHSDALKKAEGSSSKIITEPMYRKIYYLPRKEIITPSSRLHSIILMGHGITKEGKLYFIGQNSWGTGWGCEGYIQIVIEEKCDIICLKH
ncbi:hypothetical protein DY000_02051401 [Brassica cretica]|uniref:Peptidase C1A papain C-terminal domain-containing protein n=1 Tax=Brassica cretica TaxID=69181 RepID=A0ABQ7EPZ3_BRACR|nr:hypothetical protein DY000_02051401 [Brassica cretica]